MEKERKSDMSLVRCPECGTKISDQAVACPHCGFKSKKSSLPISVQDQYMPIPVFEYDIEEWKPNRNDLIGIAIEDGKQLFAYFGVWKNIEMRLPAIAEVIKSLAQKETILVADYDKYVADLINKGVYRFTVDKKGEILPTIREGRKIVKQVRLKEMNFTPQLNQSLNNLAVHAQLAQILDEIEYVGDAIRGIHKELQNNRIALAESAWDKLRQTRRIQDSRLREIALLSVIGTATDAKRVLMRDFEDNKAYLEERDKKNTIKKLIEYKEERDVPTKAVDTFQNLISITNCVQVECEGYAMLGEYEACKVSLLEFRKFIKGNKLDNRDTLLRMNLSLKTKQHSVVNQFSDIAKRITNFDVRAAIDYNVLDLLGVK